MAPNAEWTIVRFQVKLQSSGRQLRSQVCKKCVILTDSNHCARVSFGPSGQSLFYSVAVTVEEIQFPEAAAAGLSD